MTTYTFIAEYSRGQVIREGSISADTKKGARGLLEPVDHA